MTNMCQFSQLSGKKALFVNADLVRIVKEHSSAGTDIIFDDRQAITVTEMPEEVAKRLEGARTKIDS